MSECRAEIWCSSSFHFQAKDDEAKKENESVVAEEPVAKKLKLDDEVEQPSPQDIKDNDSEDVDGSTISKVEVFDDDEKPDIIDDQSEQVPAFEDWPKDPIASIEKTFLTQMPEVA